MIEQSLSKLYQQMSLQAQAGSAELFDGETLLAAAAGTLSGDRRDEVAARLSRSPLQTDLVRMLHELAVDSAVVADAVNERCSIAHSRGGRRLRHNGGNAPRHSTRLRWVGLAACLMLVFGFVLWQPHSSQPADGDTMAATKPDRIFTSQDRIFAANDASASQGVGDSVFQSSFNGG
ncbi:MAG: hypothetical protein IPP82_04165 [Xanthomonadales bacterium]|nr:hypothetical protein [Xanthomonadales bacterium]